MSLVSRVWRGEITLWKTYWFGGLFLVALSTVCDLLVLFLAERVAHHKLPATTFLLLLIAFAAVKIWSWGLLLGGVWRSAGNYQGPAFWKILARIVVVIGALSLTAFASTFLRACTNMVEAGYYNGLS
jgi:uncharacterized ion transporter superfamily protein YfcC